MKLLLSRSRAALIASAGIAAATLAAYSLHATTTVAAIVLMLGVLIAGLYNKPSVGIWISFLSALCLDYFFIPPVREVTIASSDGVVAFLAFLCASMLAAKLSSSLKRQRDELAYRQSESEKLHALSRSMLLSERIGDIPRLIVNRCIELFGFCEAALLVSPANSVHRSQSDSMILDEELKRSAVNGTLFEDARLETVVMPVTLGNSRLGSFGIRGGSLPFSTLQALGNTIAVGLAQAQAQEARHQAEAVRRGEELKSIMIDALAHDLKTPLTAIEASADVLLHAPALSAVQRQDLLEVIEQSSKGLSTLLSEAIHLARIDANKFRLERRLISPCELIDAALTAVGERLASHRISLQIEPDLPEFNADFELMVQVVKQLLDNASKYSPSRSLITITAALESPEMVMISVRDQGTGLTELEQGRVFDKFYRGRYDHSAIQGTGMGLAIAKEIMEAHGGSIIVESVVGHGSEFKILLHSAVASRAGFRHA